ncbi:MAG: hypothetical protein WCV69_01900 [Patescibacteria group bacterium]|jgi:hypothetical protein
MNPDLEAKLLVLILFVSGIIATILARRDVPNAVSGRASDEAICHSRRDEHMFFYSWFFASIGFTGLAIADWIINPQLFWYNILSG